jgi:cholesterol transport system auxiliary component
MKRRLGILAGLAMGMAACGGNVATTDVVRYDFGGLGAMATASGSRVPLGAIDVQAASWLSGPDMHFRLAYAEPLQRRSYAESRWAAPPAELLEAFLKRRIAYGQAEPGGTGCRLRLALDELEQRFDDPQGSSAVLEVRAQLSFLRGAEALAQRSFLIQKAAPAPDARGGAAAARDAMQALADGIVGWLGELSRDKPAIVDRCRS